MLIFEIFSWGAYSRTPLESFLALKFFKINSARKIRLKKVTKIDAPSLKKILNTPLTRNIFKRLIYARFRV